MKAQFIRYFIAIIFFATSYTITSYALKLDHVRAADVADTNDPAED